MAIVESTLVFFDLKRMLSFKYPSSSISVSKPMIEEHRMRRFCVALIAWLINCYKIAI